MARNQKRDVRAQQLRNYALFALSVGIIATMVMGFVLQRRAHTRLGAQKRQLETRIAELRRQTNYHAILLAQRSSPLELIRRAEPLGLVKIAASQRLFVQLPAPMLAGPILGQPKAPVTSLPSGQFATAIPR